MFLTLAPPLGFAPLPPRFDLLVEALFFGRITLLGGGEAASEPARDEGRFFLAGGFEDGRCD